MRSFLVSIGFIIVALLGALVLSGPFILPDGAATTGDPRADAPHSGAFTYTLGSAFSGTFSGACNATIWQVHTGGVGSLQWTSSDAGLLVYTTQITYLVTDDERIAVDSEQQLVRHGGGGGTSTVHWDAGAHVDAVGGKEGRAAAGRPFGAVLDTDDLVFDRPINHVPDPVVRQDVVAFRDPSQLDEPVTPPTPSGWNRLVHADNGTLRLTGNLSIFLTDSRIILPDGTETLLGPHQEVVPGPTPRQGAHTETVRHRHAWLLLEHAEATVAPDQGALHCRGIRGAVDGSMTAWQATGAFLADDVSYPFDDRVITIDGSFRIEEEPQSAEGKTQPVSAEVYGSFRAVGVDFDPLADAFGISPWERLGFWTLFFSTILAGAYAVPKLIGALFSRFDEAKVTDHPKRRMILEAVRAEEGIGLKTLTERLDLPISTLRHHAKMLEQHGRIRSERIGGERLFWSRDRGTQVRRAAILERDPHAAAVAAVVAEGRIRLSDAVRNIRADYELSRPGAFKAVQRAERLGLVRREKVGGAVWLHPE